MVIVKKAKKVYPLLNVLKLMRIAKPLTVRGAFEFYTAPIKWLANLGFLGVAYRRGGLAPTLQA